MSNVIVIGAGPMGLAAAHRAATEGHEVHIIEADDRPGGMAAHFDFGGLSIERFYHFVCKSDTATFALMDELGIGDKMRWTPTSMAYYMKGKIHPWGDPFSLLSFPHLSLISKLRTGLQMFRTTKRKNFASIESLTARQWLERGSGKAVYDTLWKRLMELKFYQLSDDISASWIATRVKRVGSSRRSIFQEELGYIDGGTQTLVDALVGAFVKKGGNLHLSTLAERVETVDQRVTGVTAGGRFFAADAVISTIPTPLVSNLVPDLPTEWREKYDAIRNIGVVCVLLKLKRSVTPNFWLNIVDPDIEIPGLIEFSNLRPVGDTIVYVPYYMPAMQPKWKWTNQQFVEQAFGYIQHINPTIENDDLVDTTVGRLRYAQPVCEPNFRSKLPPIQTPILGLQIADTCYYYPEDRGVAESIRYGQMMAASVPESLKVATPISG
ncbi:MULTISPECIES: NAD(P)/FAD-dependent oxidoreductase [unclassified Mesorhizobium]|uniref:NAD(P)/FAD-dependent oxidoreductase n=1 Tax=unclassified Mesorhizobium TaxID=325217 RepID=UPI000FE9B68A|nr:MULTISPECIES: NAD(P)/FAD-dependent oxidoreductase [unclassified Mesorhizobium]RWI30023.1 MAG: NAD(P)/FAD-dependent oxidoreductase [Mesorhizobium sp.]RWK53403.1 MAG: NAD(P)/FAD-dependent oxidoreductase [Mesorhizobium sp.]RWK98393.1 MAG: NAD(P)/FAD-dependent oxidoreductase [Mesorhizobium sp.]RWL04034.1 MAG: NAD(P)/FAD-dependent oxidoreductase [Mesorhizobium sp.]TIP58459.1 MAG: NAD(P)/FAD-dependent oxidoreductase [Mesorhizobium sp.]